jgi:hypothetical protein
MEVMRSPSGRGMIFWRCEWVRLARANSTLAKWRAQASDRRNGRSDETDGVAENITLFSLYGSRDRDRDYSYGILMNQLSTSKFRK